MKKNTSHSNAYNYFIKDFIFIYFSLKRLHFICYNNYDEKLIFETLKEIKEDFLNKFKDSISVNFQRAFTLIKNIERNADTTGNFEKGNIVNIHIIEHLVDYIKKMSQSFLDLYDEFYIENDSFFFSNEDSFILQLKQIFKDEILNNYFSLVFTKLNQVLELLKNEGNDNEILLIQKFFYFYYIIYKLNDVFISFKNSNVGYLINDDIIEELNIKLNFYMSSLFKTFIERVSFKMILLNKDNFNYYAEFNTNLITQIKLFFKTENYNNNRAFEKPVIKFIIYLYAISSILLLMINCQIDFEAYDNLLNDITEISQIFIRLNSNDSIIKLHEFNKMLSQMNSIDDINNTFQGAITNKCKMILIQTKKFGIDSQSLIQFLAGKQISMDNYIKTIALVLIKYMRINFEYVVLENVDIQNELYNIIENFQLNNKNN